MSDPVGEFAHRHTGNSYSRNADGTIVASSNWEGTASGFGAVFGTLSVPLPEGGAKSGTCTWIGQAYPEGSPWVSGAGDGTWEQIEDKYRWRLHFPAIEISSGERLRCEGEIDLATRTFTGQMFDAG